MIYTIIAFIIIILIVSIFNFRKDMSEKNVELEKVGGIKEKYKELIGYFDDFDQHSKPLIVTDKPNDYEIGWTGQSTISKFWFNEIHSNLYVRYTIKYNETNIKKMGVNMNELPNLNERLEWKFDENMSQREMIEIIADDINQAISKY